MLEIYFQINISLVDCLTYDCSSSGGGVDWYNVYDYKSVQRLSDGPIGVGGCKSWRGQSLFVPKVRSVKNCSIIKSDYLLEISVSYNIDINTSNVTV